MTRSERHLAILLRVFGTVNALAIVAVFMPRAWILACHEMLGMGPFPGPPVAEYLARSTSLSYVLWGVLLWWLSFDVRRLRRVIAAVGVATVACGVVLLSVDIRAAMPWWWTVGEGPFVVALGVVFLLLLARARGEVCATEATASEEEGVGPVTGDSESDADAPADT
jgi:hypothetical protein